MPRPDPRPSHTLGPEIEPSWAKSRFTPLFLPYYLFTTSIYLFIYLFIPPYPPHNLDQQSIIINIKLLAIIAMKNDYFVQPEKVARGQPEDKNLIKTLCQTLYRSTLARKGRLHIMHVVH